MKTLLVINDNTPQGDHAVEFALLLAQKTEANIIMANTCVAGNAVPSIPGIPVGNTRWSHEMEEHTCFNTASAGYVPKIKEIDISAMNDLQLAELTVTEQVWMVIKGMADHSCKTLPKMRFNVNTLLNHSRCPLLFIPLHWHLKPIERLVYIADLRYCRLQFVRFMADIARPYGALISIANLSASGLPNMSEVYANTVFRDEICVNVNYDNMILNNIRETDLVKAVDVIINGMHNDVLVMVNHRFHFEEIVGRYITEELPAQITVPLLIFPY